MSDESETTETANDPRHEQQDDLTGWSRKALQSLDSGFAERVERFVRHHAAEGARLRPVDHARNGQTQLTVQVLDEKGERTDIGVDGGQPWFARLQGASFGLVVVIDLDEKTVVLAPVNQTADEPAGAAPATSSRSARARRRVDAGEGDE